MAMAIKLRNERNHLALTLPQNICSSEKGPSKVSLTLGVPALMYHRAFQRVKISVAADSTPDAEIPKRYFCAIKFPTQVLISVWKRSSRATLTTRFTVI